jgi:hypothetical protein
MDQIVAQALTTYAKIHGAKRAVATSVRAAYLDAGKPRVNGNGDGKGNGNGNANGNGRRAPSPELLLTNK